MIRYKITYCWWPRRLAQKQADGFEFVGWVWLQKARLVKNISHGWIAFLEEQTPEKLRTCPCCEQPWEHP